MAGLVALRHKMSADSADSPYTIQRHGQEEVEAVASEALLQRSSVPFGNGVDLSTEPTAAAEFQS